MLIAYAIAVEGHMSTWGIYMVVNDLRLLDNALSKAEHRETAVRRGERPVEKFLGRPPSERELR
jgi:hypothetical protein